MPAIFINPNKDDHYDFLYKLNEQNQDLRLFISDKLQKEEIEMFPGKKAIGDIYDDTHISTASEGAFCAIYFEGEDQTLRETFISSILDSNAQRFIWISTFEIDKDVEKLANLIFVKYQKGSNYNSLILSLEETEEIDKKYIELKL